MAQITDYASLKTAVAEYYARDGDSDFIARIDTFIGLAEAGFNRNLKSREMEHTTTRVTDVDGYALLPADWIAPRSFSATTSGTTYLTDDEGNYLLDDDGNYLVDVEGAGYPVYRPLSIISETAIASMFPYPTGAYSDYVSISGGYFRLLGNSSAEVTIDYYRKFVGLSEANTTNWILEDHPDFYLLSVMAHAGVWLKSWEEAALLSGQASVMADEINDLYAREIYNNASVTLVGSTP